MKKPKIFCAFLMQGFEKNVSRQNGMNWENIREKLENSPHSIWPLYQVEQNRHEPDVISYDLATDESLFFDCSSESRSGCRSLL